VLPPFTIVGRPRRVDLVAPGFAERHEPGRFPLPQPAPYVAVTGAVRGRRATLVLESGATRLEASYDEGAFALTVTDADGRRTRHISRRSGRAEGRVTELGLTLTGTHLTAFGREPNQWVARARHDLRDRVDTRDEAFLGALTVDASGDLGPVTAGGFGQLGLRDPRIVTTAEGEPVRDGRLVLFTATHAGPGFFDAAHTGVWSLDPESLEITHRADLFFRRPDRPGVYGDNATHLVRDGERWLVATSTWGDFERPHRKATVGITLAESGADLLAGRHVLDTRPLALPTDGLRSVGVWDPHLARIEGQWHVAFVSARKFFDFHPALAAGPTLDDLRLTAAATDRRATEGPTLLRIGDDWRVLGSDGRDGRRGERMRFPVFDLTLREVGVLGAPYPTNIPWPSLVRDGDDWLMIAFNGRPRGGRLVGYGSHGDLVVMRSGPESGYSPT
jgi:hypothetical protein